MIVYRGWKVVLAATALNFLVGINYTWSIFATGLVEQKSWTYAQASIPYSLFLLCYALSMVAAGRAQDYFGPRLVVTIGSVFAGASFLGCAYAIDQPLTASIVWGLLLGIGLACCFASTTPAAIKWFPPAQKGMITGIVVTSTGLAALVMSPLIQLLVQKEVTGAFVICGLALAIGIFLFAQFIANPPVRIRDLRNGKQLRHQPPALGDLRLYGFWLMFFLTAGNGVTLAAHLDNMVRVQAGYGKGYLAIALFAACNAGGRLAGGVLSDWIGRSRAMTVTFITMALTLVSLMTARTPILFLSAVSIMALSYGGLFSLFPSAVVSLFGESHFGLNYGIVFTALGAAGLFPYLGGILFEIQGHYFTTFTLLLGTTITAAFISLRLHRTELYG
jgi:MFS transporter, OFA family, oxalate/formate antiporter